jgi:hypothetical protein
MIFRLWKSYLQSKPDSLYDNPFWNTAEKNQYKSYDLLKSEGFMSPSLYYWADYNSIIILSITRQGEYFVIRSMFYRQTTEGTIAVTAIINTLAKKIGEDFYLFNYLPIYTSTWFRRSVGLISYVYHPLHVFNEDNAKSANDFLIRISTNLGLNVEPITYYIAPTCDEIHRMKGFDYVFTMGMLGQCGFYDAFNRIVYSTSPGGENHQHELVHVINQSFPNGHNLLLTGVSAYWGGENAHLGKPLLYHIKRINDYLQQNRALDLNKFADFYSLDSKTNPQYVLGAMICDEALKRGGIEKLKKLLNGGIQDDELYVTIEKELGIKHNNLNSFLRKKISDIAIKNTFDPLEINSSRNQKSKTIHRQ